VSKLSKQPGYSVNVWDSDRGKSLYLKGVFQSKEEAALVRARAMNGCAELFVQPISSERLSNGDLVKDTPLGR
jgi:hypothetical protein